MQHDHFQKKNKEWHFEPNPMVQGVCKAKTVACIFFYTIPFNLIYMQHIHFQK